MSQDILRNQVKVINALYKEDFNYKVIADYLEININSFYNWLSKYYNLSNSKAKQLQNFINDILY